MLILALQSAKVMNISGQPPNKLCHVIKSKDQRTPRQAAQNHRSNIQLRAQALCEAMFNIWYVLSLLFDQSANIMYSPSFDFAPLAKRIERNILS